MAVASPVLVAAMGKRAAVVVTREVAARAAAARAVAGLGRAVVVRGGCKVAEVDREVAVVKRARAAAEKAVTLGAEAWAAAMLGVGVLAAEVTAAEVGPTEAAATGWEAATAADGARAAATAEMVAGEGRTPPRCRGACACSARRSSGAAAASDR